VAGAGLAGSLPAAGQRARPEQLGQQREGGRQWQHSHPSLAQHSPEAVGRDAGAHLIGSLQGVQHKAGAAPDAG